MISAGIGGGIYHTGVVTLNNSTVTGTDVPISGGGISSGTLYLNNTVIANSTKMRKIQSEG